MKGPWLDEKNNICCGLAGGGVLGPLRDPAPGSITTPEWFLMSGGRGVVEVIGYFE